MSDQSKSLYDELWAIYKARILKLLKNNTVDLRNTTGALPGNQLPLGGPGGTGYPPDPDAVTRVQVRLDSAGAVYERRRLNLIAGAGVTITFADDSGNEEIDITFSLTGGTIGAYVVAEDGTIVLDEDGNPVTSE